MLIQDVEAREIVERAVFKHGIESYYNIDELRFEKTYELFNEDGSSERKVSEKHHYAYFPPKLKIESTNESNGTLSITTFENGIYQRTIDGINADVSQEKLLKAVNASLFVISIPFKLLDKGTDIKYIGIDTLDDILLDIVEANYNPQEYINHSSADVWRFYVDKAGIVKYNWIKTSDHFSLVENISFQSANGIIWYDERSSFRVDSLGNKLYLRASYKYSNFEVDMVK